MFDPAASGNAYTNTTLADLGADVTSPADGICDPVDFDDNINYNITSRPSIVSNTQFDSSLSPPVAAPTQPFEQKNP